jgi:predicted RNA-binding Zn ribbon-like protein
MGIEQENGRVQLSTAEEQMVCALAERTQAFFRELNPVQQLMHQAQEQWMREMLPEAATQEHARAVWAMTLRIVTRYLAERLAPLDDVETFKRGLLREVRAYPRAVVEAQVG